MQVPLDSDVATVGEVGMGRVALREGRFRMLLLRWFSVCSYRQIGAAGCFDLVADEVGGLSEVVEVVPTRCVRGHSLFSQTGSDPTAG